MATAPHPVEPSRTAILWRLAAPHSRVLVFALLLGLVVSAMDLASPLATRWVLDSLDADGGLLGPILLLAALLIVGVVVSWWQWVLLGTLAEDIVLGTREGMIRRFLAARVLPLLRRPVGELVTRVTSDSVLLREAASSSAVGLVNGVVMLVGTLVLMAVLDLVLTATTLVAVAVIVTTFAMLMPAIARAQERSQAALGELGGSLEGTLRALRTVKAARAEHRSADALLTHAVESRRHSVIAVRREALVWSVGWTGVQSAIIVILGFGAWRVSLGEMTLSTLVAFLLYAFGLLGPIMELSGNLTALQAGLAAAGRIHEVEQLELEPDEPRGTPPDDASHVPVLELVGVTARYSPDSPAAIVDVDLAVPSRGHTAIVGPSGAGKTTVLSLLLRFIEPERGEVRLAGSSYAEHGTDSVRRRLAYVEQETPTLPGSLRDNLVFAAPAATDDEVHDVLQRLRLDVLLATLPAGLDTPLSEATVSGGQRQRIALARAVLARPDVLLLDEATAQVDGISEAAIHEVIREQATDGAVVTIAHRLSTVVDADLIVVMDAARIVARGTHGELLRDNPLYATLVESLRIADAAEVANR